ISREDHDRAMARAVILYHEDQAPVGPEKKKGLRTICRLIEKEFFREKGYSITLNHVTLHSLANGSRSLSQFNAEKSWLLKEEVETVINYVQEIASWGHGLNHQRLKEHVDEICRSRLGDKFPKDGVGTKWTSRFVEKHSDRL
ncbi:hypothetical protein C8J56DRAFT_726843, partial [Mycena floridula]